MGHHGLWGPPYRSYGNIRVSGEHLRKTVVRAMRALRPAVIGMAAAGIPWCAYATGETRSLTFYNIHTKETTTITYKRDGEFDPEGMKQINHIMRDWRRDEPADMDPELIDTIWEIYQDVGSEKPIHLVSGYRSKKTNEQLRRRGGGQARKSQHILGKAADIHFPDVPVKRLRNSALVREAGGVGYYPKSGLAFVHVDTGRVRHWPRLPRQELAALFPDGETEHRPRDGRPITKRDSAIALAKLDKKIDDFIAARSKIKLPPKMMMASFTPPLKWPKASPDVIASSQRKTPPSPAEPKLAALPSQPVSTPPSNPVAVEAPPAPPQVEIATLEDAEHPEELSYQAVSVLPLMSDDLVSADRHLAQLTAPGTGEIGYLLRKADGGYSAALARGLGYTHELKLVTFGASARTAAKKPSRGKKLLRTASR